MSKYDVVIIGSGLGSLLSAYILGREGYRTCILEKEDQIGGNLQSFRRKGYVFETGMHYIGSMDPGQILHQFFKYFDLLDKVELERLDENGFDVLIHKNKEYRYPMGVERFIETMSGYFPAERGNIAGFIEKLKKIVNSQPLYNLEAIDPDRFTDNPYMRESAFDFIQSCTANVELQNVLGGLNYLYAGDRNKTPLYIYAMVFWFFLQSAWGFKKGSYQVAEGLAENIRAMGGCIRTKSKVTALVTSDAKITHALINGEEDIRGDLFISGIHPASTLGLIQSDKIKKAYRRRIGSLENTPGCFSIYLIMKKGIFPFYKNNFHYHGTETVWGVNEYSPARWPESYWMYTPLNGRENGYARTISALSYMSIREAKEWENTRRHKRGSGYRQFKEEKARKLIDLIARRWPEIREGTEYCYTATPLTFRDYTGNPDGSLYGVIKDYNHPSASLILPATAIKNLMLTGQNINIHGFLGVVFGSILTCSHIIDINKITRSVINA